MPDHFPVKAIASRNGLEATRLAYEQMLAGTDTLDAAVAGVTLVEDDPNDRSVGYGGLPNENGIVELDAAVMHGPTHQAGAVASLQNIKNAAQVARLVMQQTDHVLLVGEGARAFAKAQGFKEENLLTDTSRKIWLYWKQTNSDRDDWLPPPVDQLDPAVKEFFNLKDDSGTEDRRRGAGRELPSRRPPPDRDDSLRLHQRGRRRLLHDDDQRSGVQNPRPGGRLARSSAPACTSTTRSARAAARAGVRRTCRTSAPRCGRD